MIPDRLALAITRMIAARGITPCVGVLIYVASGPSITRMDPLTATPLDVEALPVHQRRWIRAAVESLGARVEVGGQMVAVEA